MPAPRITTDLPAPEPWGSSGGPAHASGRLINPSAVIVSYIAAEPPAKPTCSRKRRRVTPFFFLVIWFLLSWSWECCWPPGPGPEINESTNELAVGACLCELRKATQTFG